MSTLHIQSKTDSAGELRLHVGVPDTLVTVDVTLPSEPHVMSQEEWAKRFDALAAQIDPSALERMPQTPIRDPFDE